jgi:hypothetical protein
MADQDFWYLATALASVPGWTELVMCEVEVEGEPERVLAPMLFTERAKAEAEWRRFENSDADAYLKAVEDYGENLINKAYANTPSLQVFSIGAWLLTEHLKDSVLRYVMVDGEVKRVADFVSELEA